ncbi:hypothetical protein [Dysgonomonas sp. 25]|uniref:hypothetical protein n=1 Tax=Dysgonomonas sp. 25 TaxID=2302933 RepID=UPI0013D8766F|nr:hypothetical protein [Dysgonomonas sp. 25]NDV69760.1 hypothetical protein [Dysgonomonas sp. 25]
MQLGTIQKKIAAGKGIFTASVVFAVIVRVLFFLYGDYQGCDYTGAGYLWNAIAPLFDNLLLSMATNVLIVAFICGLISFINSKFILIREKTSLPEAFIVLFLSSHPYFLVTSPYLIAVIFLIGVTYHLFNTYNAPGKPLVSTNIVFELLLASLFVSQILLFFPIFLIGLGIMRNLTFKSFLATLLTIVVTYFPILTYYFATGNMEGFYRPFLDFSLDRLSQMPFFGFTTINWVICGIIVAVIIFLFIYNYLNSYKDKILVRIYLNFLGILLSFSVLYCVLLNIHGQMNMLVAFFPASFLLAHYYALSRSRVTLLVFILFILVYLFIGYNSFL